MRKEWWVRGAILSFIIMMMVTLAGENILAGQGNYERILELKKEIIRIQNEGELGFRNFTLCSKVITLGHYVPLSEPKVRMGGELIIYYEPANVFTNIRGERYEIWVTQDALLFDEEGQILFEQENFLSAHFNTETPLLDLYFTNTLTLTGLPVGRYTYKVVLRDVLRDTIATKIIGFEVIE